MADLDIYNAKQKETEVYKCKSCGSNLIYFPKQGALGCLHCGGNEDFNKDRVIVPMDFNTQNRRGTDWEGTVVYRCNNCGAKEIISKFEIAKSCPFCGTTNIVESNELPGIKPNVVLPFKIDVEDAIISFKQWIKKDFFVPRKLKKSVQSDQIKGVYSPCYSFTTDSKSVYSGSLGKYYYTGSGKNRTRHIRWFNVNGNIDLSFSDILIECGPKLTQKEVEKLKPFLLNEAYKYDKKFLSGYAASNYDKTVDQSFIEARAIMKRMIEERILSQYTYDVKGTMNIDDRYFNTRFNYLLLPIYICNYKYNGKVYNFFINGTNGKVYGKKPRSIWKVGLTVLGGLAVLAGIAALVYFFVLK